KALEIRADGRVCFRELGDTLLGGALALVAHGLDQPLAMQRRADDARRSLERRQLCRVDRAPLARIVEANDPEESRLDEDRHHRLALRVDAVEIRAIAVELGRCDAEASACAQLVAERLEALLIAESL